MMVIDLLKHGQFFKDWLSWCKIINFIRVKLRCYEKATKFEKISHRLNFEKIALGRKTKLLFLLSSVKTSGRFFQKILAFSEKL